MAQAIALRCDQVNDVLGHVHAAHGDEGLDPERFAPERGGAHR